MSDNKTEAHTLQQCYRCEFGQYHYSCGTTSCVREGMVEVDGLMLCERHALQAKLEGQIECCRAIMAHIDLWSREATRRERPQITELLEVERLKVEAATEQASRDLELARLRRPICSSGRS
jgi:hypothetical protein